MRSALPLLAALGLAACAPALAPAPAPAPIRADGFARLNQATRVGLLVVTPRAIIEDSRCPINARCVWAGRAIIRTDVTGPGWRETVSLTLGQPAMTHGRVLALTSVEPGKLAGAEARPLDYRFGFEGRALGFPSPNGRGSYCATDAA